MHQNPLAQKIADVLAPLVGKTMADSVLTVQAKRIGVEIDRLSAADLPRLARQFETHLKIFVGTEKASEIGRLVASMG